MRVLPLPTIKPLGAQRKQPREVLITHVTEDPGFTRKCAATRLHPVSVGVDKVINDALRENGSDRK